VLGGYKQRCRRIYKELKDAVFVIGRVKWRGREVIQGDDFECRKMLFFTCGKRLGEERTEWKGGNNMCF
jgi:hypothetical protein